MSNNFTIDQLTKSQSIDPNSINRLYKLNMMLNFLDIKSNNPKMTQKEIGRELGTSDSFIKRYRDDIKMDSPYNRNKYKKKKSNQLTDTTTENDSSKNKTIERRLKNRLKNEIKGGNISNIHTLSGKELIDNTFQDDKKKFYFRKQNRRQ